MIMSMKNYNDTGIETFRFVAQCFGQLCYCVSPTDCDGIAEKYTPESAHSQDY
jgi:hypothetical protein